MSRIVYILSDNRSGSTLLDQLLGAHPDAVSLGEVHHLPAYALQDRTLYDPVHPLDCSCGVSVSECPFWGAVAARLGRELHSLRLMPRFLEQAGSSGSLLALLQRMPRRWLIRRPELFMNPAVSMLYGSKRVGVDSFDLFTAIAEACDSRLLVDSSKSAFRFRALYKFSPRRVFAIKLVRDYRATVHSKMKRGQALEVATREWAARVGQANMMTRDIPDNQVFALRYEDLCLDPRTTLERICAFLEVEFSEVMLWRPVSEVHHLGGSPSKFDPSRKKIELDQSYLGAFTSEQLSAMKKLAGAAASEYGYD